MQLFEKVSFYPLLSYRNLYPTEIIMDNIKRFSNDNRADVRLVRLSYLLRQRLGRN